MADPSTSAQSNEMREVLRRISEDVRAIQREIKATNHSTRTLINTNHKEVRDRFTYVEGNVESLGQSLGQSLSSPVYNSNCTLFPILAPELRSRIWKMACLSKPRIIELHAKMVPVNFFEFRSVFYCRGCSTPSVLHTS